MEKVRNKLKVEKERAILVNAIVRRYKNRNDNLAELTALAETAGAIVVNRFQQKISRINPATYIGKGKAKMLWDRVEEHQADVVIFDNDLSPGQIRELEKIVEIKILDRSELILDIFATHAQTAQAKLQVELAQLQYTYPRLTRMWTHLSRIRGGIGLRGPGETQLETDRRMIRQKIGRLKVKLKDVTKHRENIRSGRAPMMTLATFTEGTPPRLCVSPNFGSFICRGPAFP